LAFEAAFRWFHYLNLQPSHTPCDVIVENLLGVSVESISDAHCGALTVRPVSHYQKYDALNRSFRLAHRPLGSPPASFFTRITAALGELR
jgi:hypothetical protein